MNVIAVDVGTTSVRLAIISFKGDRAHKADVLASCKKDISYYQDGCRFEQNSKEIWSAICECSRESLSKSGIQPATIRGIAFSATCSLVINEPEGTLKHANDIIMWMDHRATNEAHRITSDHSLKVLNQFGGTCSPEFSLSKLIWLKDNEPKRFRAASGFFELPDWLVYKCIDSNDGVTPASSARSLCCVTCKWGYNVEEKCHCDLVQNLDQKSKIAHKIGEKVLPPGSMAGLLSRKAALDLGLMSDKQTHDSLDKENFEPSKTEPQMMVAVGSSLIDAHSGLLAMLAVSSTNTVDQHKIMGSTLCSLAGTSSCHMLLSPNYELTPGVWGPYKDVVIDGYYLLEAGQSLTGKLIEICIESHQEGKRLLEAGQKIHAIIKGLNEQAATLNGSMEINKTLHVLPTYHGNRSPLANPRLKGGVYGLSAENSTTLLEYYIATVESLSYEMNFIVETLGTKIDAILVSGGLTKNAFYMQTLADVICCRVVTLSLEDIDMMVMGSGLVARNAAILMFKQQQSATNSTIPGPIIHESLREIEYQELTSKTYIPNADKLLYHNKKYLCYREFVELSKRIDKILN